MRQLTPEQKEIIIVADNAILFIEEQLEQMGSYGEEREEQLKAIAKIKDFITWSLNNLREFDRTPIADEDYKSE